MRLARLATTTAAATAGLLSLLVGAAGCAAQPPAGTATVRPSSDAGAAPAAPDPDAEYRFVGTVLESPEHGPQLCSAVAESYPPQCGGPDAIGWDWSEVESESADGVTWGDYEVVGTWDGSALTLTRPPAPPSSVPPDPRPVDDRFAAPCPAPAGGWQVVDAALATDAAVQQAFERAATLDGAAGAWIDQNGGRNDPGRLVVVVRTTGDVDATQRSLREVWGGALCVTRAERTEAELRAVQDELAADMRAQGPGPDFVSLGVDVVVGQVEALVWLATPQQQARLDERFGSGVVRLDSVLEPIG